MTYLIIFYFPYYKNGSLEKKNQKNKNISVNIY